MASGKQGLYVVVWEWENKQRRWRPYPPDVTQQLERAHNKHLRTVFLRDSDPNLKNFNVNLSLMQQECEDTGEVVAVRRNFYPQSSPAGQGAVWQWAGDNHGDWHVYDMCVQCIIESEWATGARTVDMSKTFPLCPYIIDFCNLTQKNSRTGFIRSIRRVQQAAYPVGKPPTTPQQSQQDAGPSMYVDRSRRRGSRDEVDTNLTDGKTSFFNKLMRKYTQSILQPPDETCSICMCNFQESSGFSDDEDQVSGFHGNGVVSLSLCNHMFHAACIRSMIKTTPQFLECPNCKTIHGEKRGTQPDGKMKITILPQPLPGYRGVGTIQITYCINDGIQGPEHPHPGRPYRAIGFPRTAYLPNNQKGKKVLGLLQEAFDRKLIFTIGTSVTTGIQDAVTWNEIHHKTEWTNATGHGYPDPNYLDNVLTELAVQGVTESTLV